MSVTVRRIGDIADQIRGVTYQKQDAVTTKIDGYLPVLRAGNITEEGLTYDDLVYVPSAKISAKQKVRKNDVVIAASSGSIDIVGKAARALEDFEGGFGAFCKVLRPHEEVDAAYFAHFFKTPEYRRKVSFLAAGANINNLRNEDLDGLEIPLPPLTEQKRIAGILDAADALRAKRRAALAELDTLLQSTFLDMFGDPVTNPMGWKSVLLGELFCVKHGFAFKSEFFQSAGDFILLTPGNFFETGGYRDRGDKQKFYNGPIPTEYVLDRNDLLVAMTEQAPGLLGSPILVPESNRFLHNQRLGKLDFKQQMPKWYLFHLFNTNSIRNRIHNESSGTKVKHTSPTKIESITIGLPPADLQWRFAAIAESVERQKARMNTHLAELDALFASLQSRAFNGEL